MEQKKLKGLLEEAAKPDCSWQRRDEIKYQLGKATAALGKNDVYKIRGEEAGLLLLLKTLYVDTIENRPELLPTLFPVFALICGDREYGTIITEVDWSLA